MNRTLPIMLFFGSLGVACFCGVVKGIRGRRQRQMRRLLRRGEKMLSHLSNAAFDFFS